MLVKLVLIVVAVLLPFNVCGDSSTLERTKRDSIAGYDIDTLFVVFFIGFLVAVIIMIIVMCINLYCKKNQKRNNHNNNDVVLDKIITKQFVSVACQTISPHRPPSMPHDPLHIQHGPLHMPSHIKPIIPPQHKISRAQVDKIHICGCFVINNESRCPIHTHPCGCLISDNARICPIHRPSLLQKSILRTSHMPIAQPPIIRSPVLCNKEPTYSHSTRKSKLVYESMVDANPVVHVQKREHDL